MPTTIGRMAPTRDQPMEAWPAAPRTIIVTGGPTTSVVMATAPRSASLPIEPIRPAYMALLAPVQAARMTIADRPRKLLPVNRTISATAMTTTCLAMMMIAPRAAAAGALLNEIVVPTMRRNAPTSGLTPFCVMPSVKLPSVLNISGNSVLSRQPNRSGTRIVAPGMEDILKKGFFSSTTAVESLIGKLAFETREKTERAGRELSGTARFTDAIARVAGITRRGRCRRRSRRSRR